MAKQRLLWKIYPSYLLVIVLCASAVMLLAMAAIRDANRERVEEVLATRSLLVEQALSGRVEAGGTAALEDFCKALGAEIATRITFITPDGRVLCDSEANPAEMENHSDRPEIKAALESGSGSNARYSYTRRRDMLYYARPMKRDGRVVGVVRLALPLRDVQAAVATVTLHIAIAGIAVAVLAAGIGYLVTRRISNRIDEIKNGAERFARGDLSYKVPSTDMHEFASLADSLNRMAAELDDKVRTINRQRNEQQAILAGMSEGVLAVDLEEHVISLNRAAATLLAATAPAEGRSLPEVARNSELEHLVSTVLETGDDVEGEVQMELDGPRTLEVRGAPLRDSAGAQIGAVVVLNDITRLRRLENMRRDFVANVSHELKTPVTSIKGFVETLREGALDEPEQAHRFLDIVARQVDRLNAIIDDLLSLARIEQEAGEARVDLAEARVCDVLSCAISACEPKAAARSISITLACEPALTVRMNPALVEQAVINLVDNAVKYSEPGAQVTVHSERSGGEVLISVSDTGIGIERKHLPRLFERFYRADKARSRSLGGTGLGLAIVKHIAQAHGGSVEVDSTPGKGSTFTIHIPS